MRSERCKEEEGRARGKYVRNNNSLCDGQHTPHALKYPRKERAKETGGVGEGGSQQGMVVNWDWGVDRQANWSKIPGEGRKNPQIHIIAVQQQPVDAVSNLVNKDRVKSKKKKKKVGRD